MPLPHSINRRPVARLAASTSRERAIREFEIARHKRRDFDPRGVVECFDPLLGVGQSARATFAGIATLRRLELDVSKSPSGHLRTSGFSLTLAALSGSSLTYTRIDQPSRDITHRRTTRTRRS